MRLPDIRGSGSEATPRGVLCSKQPHLDSSRNRSREVHAYSHILLVQMSHSHILLIQAHLSQLLTDRWISGSPFVVRSFPPTAPGPTGMRSHCWTSLCAWRECKLEPAIPTSTPRQASPRPLQLPSTPTTTTQVSTRLQGLEFRVQGRSPWCCTGGGEMWEERECQGTSTRTLHTERTSGPYTFAHGGHARQPCRDR